MDGTSAQHVGCNFRPLRAETVEHTGVDALVRDR